MAWSNLFNYLPDSISQKLSVALMSLGLSNGLNTTPIDVNGVFSVGHEQYEFEPDQTGKDQLPQGPWYVTGDPEALKRLNAAVLAANKNHRWGSVRIRATGTLSPPAGKDGIGPLGRYRHQLMLTNFTVLPDHPTA